MTITTPAMTDVNAAFLTERHEQIADAERAFEAAQAADAKQVADFDTRVRDGKLRPLGGSRFQVTDPGSYDNGEILVLQRRLTDGATLILPEHGLDETTGQVALYASTPMWHGLGTIIPGGISSIDSVLRLAALDWDVVAVPAQYAWNGELRIHADRFHTVRSDTGDALGVVGRVYEKGGIVQNRAAFEFILGLVDEDSLVWESAGALRGGRRVFVCTRLPETLRVDAAGINDEVQPMIALINSHDGTDPLRVVTTPWRIGCGNTERFAIRNAFSSWEVRHTGAHAAKMGEGRRTLNLAHRYYARWLEDAETLARTAVNLDDFEQIVDDVWPMDDDLAKALADGADLSRGQKSAHTRYLARRNKLVDLFETNAAKLGRTAYAAERAATEYLDWQTAVRVPKSMTESMVRATRVLEGADDDKKSAVHRQLLTLVHH